MRAGAIYALLVALCIAPVALAIEFPHVTVGRELRFPEDEGSHGEFRTEWWYVTGWLDDESGIARGFQITFFRSRPGTDEENPSAFAAKQLLFAHAALSDPTRGRLLRDEKAAREGFGLAAARAGLLDVFIDDWSLRSESNGYRAQLVSREFGLDLTLVPTQPPLLQGQAGFSQKLPDARFASYYYSLPQLKVSGTLSVQGRAQRVRGVAWLDHEWSSGIMDAQSRGWDWMGVNFADGSALMAFQVRDLQGKRQWAAASVRGGGETAARTYAQDEIDWQVLRRWRSPRTGIEYPVAWRARVGPRTLVLEPLLNDQENDARGSTGTLYWEGAVNALDESGQRVGRGYLELTGYAAPVRF